MSLTYRQIDDQTTVELFLDLFEKHINFRLPMAYANQGDVWAGFDKNGEMKSGFIIIKKPNFRSFLFVPDHVKEENEFFHNTHHSDLVEFNGVWLEPSLRGTKESFFLWFKLLQETLRTRRPYMMCMWSSENQGLNKLYQNFNPTILYKGAPNVIGNSSTHKQITVTYLTRANLIKAFFPMSAVMLKKSLGLKVKKKQKLVSPDHLSTEPSSSISGKEALVES
ncbi:MAG: hypothetical protein ACOH5I_23585 [Oligoflexus sp.]